MCMLYFTLTHTTDEIQSGKVDFKSRVWGSGQTGCKGFSVAEYIQGDLVQAATVWFEQEQEFSLVIMLFYFYIFLLIKIRYWSNYWYLYNIQLHNLSIHVKTYTQLNVRFVCWRCRRKFVLSCMISFNCIEKLIWPRRLPIN